MFLLWDEEICEVLHRNINRTKAKLKTGSDSCGVEGRKHRTQEKAHKPMRPQRKCVGSGTYWSGWVFPEESSWDPHRCGWRFPFPPLELGASSAGKTAPQISSELHKHGILRWQKVWGTAPTPTDSPRLTGPPSTECQGLNQLMNFVNPFKHRSWVNIFSCQFKFTLLPQLFWLLRHRIWQQLVNTTGFTFLDSSSWWRPMMTSSPRPDRNTYMKILRGRNKSRIIRVTAAKQRRRRIKRR